MKIIIISDLHGNLPLNIPKGDLLLICGDIVPLSMQLNSRKSKRWFINEFYQWASNRPVKKVLFIAGNHDWMPYWDEGIWLHNNFPYETKVTYLQDEIYEYEGIKIYGTPWCKIFYNWAFNINNKALQEKYSLIPDDLDILMTHDAPLQNELGIIHDKPYAGDNASNEILTKIVSEKKPKYHFCGHIHSGNHELKKIDNTYFANCSILNEQYVEYYQPLVIEYDKI